MTQDNYTNWRNVNLSIDDIEALCEMQQAANESKIQAFQSALWANAITYDMAIESR
jgi:hypothetical protein